MFGPEQRGRAGEAEPTALLLPLPQLIKLCTGACSWTSYKYSHMKCPSRNPQLAQYHSRAMLPLPSNAELILQADTERLSLCFHTLPTAELR